MKCRHVSMVMITVTLAYSAPLEYEYISIELTSSKPIERQADQSGNCCQPDSPRCCPYDYDDRCGVENDRTLCGYNKNPKKEDEIINLTAYGLPCRVNDDRLECGYNGPYVTDPTPNPNRDPLKLIKPKATNIPDKKPNNKPNCCDCCDEETKEVTCEPTTITTDAACETTTKSSTTTTTPKPTTTTPKRTTTTPKPTTTTPKPTTTTPKPTTTTPKPTTTTSKPTTTTPKPTTTTPKPTTTTPKPTTTTKKEISTRFKKLDKKVTKKPTTSSAPCVTVEERCVITYESPCIMDPPCQNDKNSDSDSDE